MKNIIYLIEKSCVYNHGVFGVFESEKLAIRRCKDLCSRDSDDYHKWSVNKFDRNKIFTRKEVDNDGVTNEIFSCYKEVE